MTGLLAAPLTRRWSVTVPLEATLAGLAVLAGAGLAGPLLAGLARPASFSGSVGPSGL